MDNVLPPPRPTGHDFSQQSLSNLRSSGPTTTTAVTNNVVHVGSTGAGGAVVQLPPTNNNGAVAVQPPERPGLNTQPTTNNNDNNDESQNTQETYTQQLTQNPELTQLGFFDDDDENDCCDDDDDNAAQNLQSPVPIDPLTLPWGRLMPVTLDTNTNGTGGSTANGGLHNGKGNGVTNEGGGMDNRPSSPSRGALEMLPRPPPTSTSGDCDGGGNAMGGPADKSPNSSQYIQFLGLKNLLPSDRFNEYMLGRSVKVSFLKLLGDRVFKSLVERGIHMGEI